MRSLRDDPTNPAAAASADAPTARTARIALAIGAGGSGLVVAGFAALESRIAWRPGTLTLPWGGLLAIGASVVVVLVARTVGRGVGLAAAAGWIIGTGLILGGRPEGDYVFAQDTLGLGYLLICTVLVISAAAGGGGR